MWKLVHISYSFRKLTGDLIYPVELLHYYCSIKLGYKLNLNHICFSSINKTTASTMFVFVLFIASSVPKNE